MTFIRWGYRWFSDGRFHRVPFQPVLYLFLFFGTVRVACSDHTPIRFEVVGPWVYSAWIVVGLLCPLLALLSWWLIVRSRWALAALLGTYLRVPADAGMFFSLLAFHLAGVLNCHAAPGCDLEETIFSRYLMAATIVFVGLLLVRDVWSIALINRMAKSLGGRDVG